MPQLPGVLPFSFLSHPGDYSINYFHKHFAFCRIFFMLPDGNSPPDVFFLPLLAQSFNAITSDTSPHQMSVLSFPLKKLTDDGPDTGNYYVRTVTANFNHNVPGERGSKSNEQLVRLRAVREPWAARRCRGRDRGAGERGRGAGGSTSLPPSAGAAPGAGAGCPGGDPGGCSALGGSSGILVHGARRTYTPQDGQPVPAPSADGSACVWAPSPRPFLLTAGLSPTWLPPPYGSGCGGCVAGHEGCWLGSATPDAFMPCTVCSARIWAGTSPPVMGRAEPGRRVLHP